jgi:hypothetical protein
MKHILICDARKPEEVVGLCRELGIGIELQTFFHPDAVK